MLRVTVTRNKSCNMEALWMCVYSDILYSTDIMLIIERRIDNGIISPNVYAGKKNFCLSEDLTKSVNTNLQFSHDIIGNDEIIEEELTTINTETLNMKSDTENAFNHIVLLKMR